MAGTAPARAHGTIEVRTMLERVEPAVPGLTMKLVLSVTAELVVDNRTTELLEVLDDAGNPFMRIGPSGVEGDFNSPIWLAVNAPSGVPDQTTLPTGPPRWQHVSTDPTWGWFDHRMHPAGTIAGAWEVPMRLGGRPVTAHGRVEPLTGSARVRADPPIGASPHRGPARRGAARSGPGDLPAERAERRRDGARA